MTAVHGAVYRIVYPSPNLNVVYMPRLSSSSHTTEHIDKGKGGHVRNTQSCSLDHVDQPVNDKSGHSGEVDENYPLVIGAVKMGWISIPILVSIMKPKITVNTVCCRKNRPKSRAGLGSLFL